MPSTLIFGGSGKLAKLITHRLKAKDYTIYSVIRRPEHISELEKLGALPIVQSLEDSTVHELAQVIKSRQPDSIIFAAGGGWRAFEDPKFNRTVDRDAAIRVFDAMVEADCTRRIVIISTVDARNRSQPRPVWYDDNDQELSDQLWTKVPAYVTAKFEADKNLIECNAERGLQYTVVRPTWYNDEEGTGKIEAGLVGMSPRVSRDDVAGVFVECLEDNATIGLVFEVVGGSTPIKEAVKSVIAEKIDSFGKQYR